MAHDNIECNFRDIVQALRKLLVNSNRLRNFVHATSVPLCQSGLATALLNYCISEPWSGSNVSIFVDADRPVSLKEWRDISVAKGSSVQSVIATLEATRCCVQAGLQVSAGSQLDVLLYAGARCLQFNCLRSDELGIELFLFAGAYDQTPAGPHVDKEHTGLMHLGPAEKRFSFWMDQPDLVDVHTARFETLTSTCCGKDYELSAGEMLAFPSGTLHVASSPSFSVSVGLNLYIDSFQERVEQRINTRWLVGLSSSRRSAEITQIASNIFAPGTPCWRLRVETNAGFVSPPIETRSTEKELTNAMDILPGSVRIGISVLDRIGWIIVRGYVMPIWDDVRLVELLHWIENENLSNKPTFKLAPSFLMDFLFRFGALVPKDRILKFCGSGLEEEIPSTCIIVLLSQTGDFKPINDIAEIREHMLAAGLSILSLIEDNQIRLHQADRK